MRPNPRTFVLLILIVVAMTLMAASSAWAAGKYKVLYAFKGGTDGTFPSGALVFDASGNLYGTTVNGGSSGTCLYAEGTGCGIVFKLSPAQSGKWKESVLYRLQGGSDGGNPNGSLIFDTAGNLYGTTVQGGEGTSFGCGTIFQLSPGSAGWTESLVRTFCASGANDGYFPRGGLVRDSAGNLYGMTESGGADLGGVAFEFTPNSGSWTENVLHSFCLVGNCSATGAQPVAGLTLDAAGNVYGTTIAAGQVTFGCSGRFPPGCGLVFKLTPHSGGGWTESVTHYFKGPDGAGPASSLTFDSHGNLYGTTSYDGAFGFGTVFKLTPNSHGRWTESILYNFRSGSSQGAINSGVVFDAAGNLYGATDPDGNCCSLVYRLSPGKGGRWEYRILHQFSGGQDGGRTDGNLILDTKGNLYGTAGTGGANGSGVVFEITP
jgi:uncharacterized repeat protein (TIGR03803 family)